mgnify:CR=1 FL=1
MFKFRINPHWEITRGSGQALDTSVLLALLRAIEETGSIARAAQVVGLSYRYAWGLLRDAEELFGYSLMQTGRGRGTQLSPLAEKLIWADRRIAARLSPTLDSLASELEAELGKTLGSRDGIHRLLFTLSLLGGNEALALNATPLPTLQDITREGAKGDKARDNLSGCLENCRRLLLGKLHTHAIEGMQQDSILGNRHGGSGIVDLELFGLGTKCRNRLLKGKQTLRGEDGGNDGGVDGVGGHNGITLSFVAVSCLKSCGIASLVCYSLAGCL